MADANQQMQTALKDLDGAVRYISSGEKQHPNRIDICEAKGAVLPEAKPAIPVPATPALGQQPAFGQPSLQSTFGQPSSLPPNPFAKPAAGAFANKPVPAFGNPPTTFGQPTPLNPFAQKANPPTTQPPPSNPFATAQPPRNPFAAAQQPSTNPFAAAQTQPTPNHLATAQSPPSNPFAPTVPRNPFDTAQPPAPTPFHQPAQPTFTPASFPPSGPAPTSTPQNTRKGPNDRYTLWRGKPISYIDNEPCFKRPDGNWERVWFPEGVPTWTKEPEVPEGYWTREAEEEYAWAREHGSWREGKMPAVMPKAVWTSWDF